MENMKNTWELAWKAFQLSNITCYAMLFRASNNIKCFQFFIKINLSAQGADSHVLT